MAKKQFIPKQKKQAEAENGYRERAAREKARVKLATDSEFWLAFCFKNETELDRFRSMFGVEGKFIRSDKFAELLQDVKPTAKKKGFPAKPTGAKADDPLANVEYTGNLEHDCVAEAMALYECLRKAKSPEPCKHSTDSEHWLCVVFPSRNDREAFLTEWNLWGFGDKYMDGTAWLDAM